MSEAVVRKYRLEGHYAKRTMVISGIPFVDGETVVKAPQEQHVGLAKLLSYYGAKEVTDGKRNPDSKGTGSVDSQVQSKGGEAETGEPTGDGQVPAGAAPGDPAGRLGTSGAGQAEGLNLQSQRIHRAVMSLDAALDSNWTKDGKPSLAAVEKAVGFSGLTRQMVDQAAPGLGRHNRAGTP